MILEKNDLTPKIWKNIPRQGFSIYKSYSLLPVFLFSVRESRSIFGPLIPVLRHIRSFKRHQKTYHEDENVLWRFQTEDDKKKLEEIQAEELDNQEEEFYEYDYEDIEDDEDFDDGRSMYS